MAKKSRRHKEATGFQSQATHDYLREMESIMRKLSYRQSVYTVFFDFVAMAALSLSNAVDLAQHKARERQYLTVVQRYTKEEMSQFPRLLALLAEALEYELADVLGALYHRLEIHNHQAGQFFTPFPVCVAMAHILVHDAKHVLEEREFIRVHEPCVGSGAMIIALAQACREAGIHYQRHMHVTAIDIDVTAVHMAYIQLFLLHIPAVVIHGNTLSGEVQASWYTAAHILDLWHYKLLRDRRQMLAPDVEVPPAMEVADVAEAPEPPEPVQVVAPVLPAVSAGSQLTLF